MAHLTVFMDMFNHQTELSPSHLEEIEYEQCSTSAMMSILSIALCNIVMIAGCTYSQLLVRQFEWRFMHKVPAHLAPTKSCVLGATCHKAVVCIAGMNLMCT